MKEFTIVIKQISREGIWSDRFTVSFDDIRKILPKKIRDRITHLNPIDEIEKVTLSIEEA